MAASLGRNMLVASSMQEFDKLLDIVMYKPIPVPGFVKRHIGEEMISQYDFLDSIFWSLLDDHKNRPLDDRLYDVSVPTLIIWGRNDRILDVSCTELMQDRIPDNECVIFEETGHVPMLECPARTAAVQRDFIRRRHH